MAMSFRLDQRGRCSSKSSSSIVSMLVMMTMMLGGSDIGASLPRVSVPPPIACPLCGTIIAATWCHACRVDVIPVSVGWRSLPGMARPLDPATLLGIHIGAICSRNRYSADTAPVIAELLATAGPRTDILAMETGRWAGYYDDVHTRTLVAAIVADIPGAASWIADGARRRDAPPHGTTGFGPAYVPPTPR
ncbi:hypothetical protein IFU40_05995 [Microbacterium sp. CFBP 13617]|uniref:hypothetical protein n=1 Tax=Microbacterium sp. CFBP 13617 TaxID=2774035 RepID=UPI00177B81A4|nr:hypothetical protein [Microbacterium sp. CFBP 13617]MBD8218183.1 hypothetical protein [Microbacterium sp. CFBP 13617]